MNILDFISDSPKAYIFHKSSNKTNLGGIFTVLYFMILIFITVVYIIDFYQIEKYEFSHFYKKFSNKTQEQDLKKKYSKDININREFGIQILDEDGKISNKNFRFIVFYDEKDVDIEDMNNQTVERMINNPYYMNETYTNKLDKMHIWVVYQKPLCILNKKEKNNQYTLGFFYESKNIDLEGNTPIKDDGLFFTQSFYLKEFSFLIADFSIYNFEEKKGVLSRFYDKYTKNESDISPYFSQYEKTEIPNIEMPAFEKCRYTEELGDFKFVLWIMIDFKYDGIHLYKRKEKSIWDTVANIAALGTTLYNLLGLSFRYIYSRNFDNYKIVEKILNKKTNNIFKNGLKYDDNIKDLENNLINVKNNDDKLYNDDNGIDNDDMIINDSDEIYDNDNDNESNVKLPKLRFYDFIFNNIYIKKCCKSFYHQKLISSCNNILYKYFSIENMLYNHILFENLIKDYHWNNPKFKSIFHNDLIIELKNI